MTANQRLLFSHLYDEYAPSLYGLLLRSLNDEATAQRLLELTFLKAWEQFEEVPSQHKLSWLLRLARLVGFETKLPFPVS